MITVDSIDLGTSETKIATADAAGQPFAIPNARGELSTPSVVYWPASGAPLIGVDARQQGVLDPARVAQNFKLLLGTTSAVTATSGHTATDATAALVGYAKSCVERHLGRAMTHAAITCPANFRDDQKQALLEACQRNGLEALCLIPEPSAAAYGYAVTKLDDGSVLLVYDLGGGTFDVSVVRLDGGELKTLATEGVPHLGGNDFTHCGEEIVLDEVQRVCKSRPKRGDDPLFDLELWDKCNQAKHSLATQSEVPVVVHFKGKQVIARVTAVQFQAAIKSLVQQSLDTVDKALDAAKLNLADVNRLLLVGGSSRLLYVQQRVADHTGLVPRTDIDPAKAVVYGAVLAGLAEAARRGQTASWRGRVIPAPTLLIRDVTAHAVGCCVVDVVGSQKELRNAVVIPKATPIPCRRTEHYFLEHPDQSEARIELLQGEPDARREDCLLIGELVLDGLPPEPVRTQRIQVEFSIDRNGMATIVGTDTVSGASQTVSVDYKRGIQPHPKSNAA